MTNLEIIIKKAIEGGYDGYPDCPHDYDNPIRKGRAHYECKHCGKDITLELVLLYEAQNI